MFEVAVVVGAGQGLGPALARRLAGLWAERGLVRSLDGAEPAEVEAFARGIAERHGGVDLVISNAPARVVPGVRNQDQVRGFVETNNHGTHQVISAFLPLLNDGARFVVVASRFGVLHHIPQHLRARFDIERMSLDDLAKVMGDYVDAVELGRAAEEGWPGWINVPSRIGQVAAMKVAARELAAEARRRDIVINAACPALDEADECPDRAADDVTWLATLPAGTRRPYGELVQHRKVVSFAT